MKPSPRKYRSPLKRHGGKYYLARRIIALFPPHRTYIEPCFGAGSILLNKPPSEYEVIGDLDPKLFRFWLFLRCYGDEILNQLKHIDYCEVAFKASREAIATPGYAEMNPVRFAVHFLVANRMSRGGLGESFAWSERLRGGQPGDLNAWITMLAELPAVIDRIRGVEMVMGDAEALIRANDYSMALTYADPPYVPDTRTVPNAYDFEMTITQHESLLKTLLECKGKVFLSGYKSELYCDMLTAWVRHEFEMPNHSGQGKTKGRRVECLWENPAPEFQAPAASEQGQPKRKGARA